MPELDPWLFLSFILLFAELLWFALDGDVRRRRRGRELAGEAELGGERAGIGGGAARRRREGEAGRVGEGFEGIERGFAVGFGGGGFEGFGAAEMVGGVVGGRRVEGTGKEMGVL